MASGLPDEHKRTVDKLKEHSDNGDIEAILGVAFDAISKVGLLLNEYPEKEKT